MLSKTKTHFEKDKETEDSRPSSTILRPARLLRVSTMQLSRMLLRGQVWQISEKSAQRLDYKCLSGLFGTRIGRYSNYGVFFLSSTCDKRSPGLLFIAQNPD